MRTPRLSSLVLLSISWVALASCALEEPGTPIEAEALCAEIAEAVCSADAICCASSPADCVEAQTSACRDAMQPLVDDPRLGYDATRGGALVASLRESGASCWAHPLDYGALLAAFAGTGGEGADCTPRDLGPGSLRTSSLSCANGLACRLYLRVDGSTEGECARRTDDACSHALDCRATEFCSLPEAWQPGVWGTCRPLRADGWECGGDLECASRHCEDGTCGVMPEARRCLETSYAELVLEQSPLAFLRFDERTGTRAEDASGSGNAGALSATVTRDVGGAIGTMHEGAPDGGTSMGGAVRFASDDASVRVAPLDALEQTEAMSLECWFRPDDVEAIRPILELSDGTDTGPHVWAFERGDEIYANFVDAEGGEHTTMSAEGSVSVDAWHHVVATWDGTTTRLYLDGRSIGSTATAGPLRTDGALYVGHRPTGEMPASYRGAIDEVAVYDRALGAAEVARHHRAAATGVLENRFPMFRWLAP